MTSVPSIHQKIAFGLKQKKGETLDFAWILNESTRGPHARGRVYWASQNLGPHLRPESAVTRLIQGIFDEHADQSFFLLRQRIWTTGVISEMDRGMIKVAAKRATGEVRPSGPDLESLEFIEVQPSMRSKDLVPATFLNEAQAIARLQIRAAAVPRGPVLHDWDRPVAALLLAADGRLLEEAVHAGSVNKTRHAEVELCQAWGSREPRAFPEGSRLFVSLKPCHMCAGMIHHLSRDNADFRVYYVADDPGTRARGTILEKTGRQQMWQPHDD